MSKFTPEEKQRIVDAFQQKCDEARCPMCSTTSEKTTDWYSIAQGEFEEDEEDEKPPFILVSAYTPLDLATINGKGSSSSLGMTVPAVSFVCRHCGYVALFSSRILCDMPVLDPDEDEGAEEEKNEQEG